MNSFEDTVGHDSGKNEYEIAQVVANRAELLLSDFGQEYATDSIRIAAQIYYDYIQGNLDKDKLTDLAKKSENDTPSRNALGISTDFAIVSDFWKNNSWLPNPEQDEWEQHIPMVEIPKLLDLSENINLETALIESIHTLAILETYSNRSEDVLKAAIKAESLYAPLCELIGFDGLAMALWNQSGCARMRNTGQGHFVDEAERFLLSFQGKDGEYSKNTKHFVKSIIEKVIGHNTHSLALGSDAKHGIVVGNGNCPDDGLRTVWRLKTAYSLARKLAKEYNPETGITEPPMDIVGITLIAENDEHLLSSYVKAAKNIIESKSITEYPSPSREQAFHIKGSEEFLNLIKNRLQSEFPDQDELFEYVPDDTGFHVAKITGFYEDKVGCVPFEVQILTQEGRRDSRVGRAAHIFYKLMRQLGHRYAPSDLEIYKLHQLNKRKQYIRSDQLVPACEDRLEALIQDL